MDIQKWIKDKGLVDTLLVGSRTKPIYLEELLKEFEQDLVKLFAIPDVVGQSEQLVCKCGLPKDKKGGSFNCMRTDCDMPIAN